MSIANLPNWSQLLHEAVHTPGLILEAYNAFHRYSLGNQLLALVQCRLRGIQPGPINTYPGWQTFNRHVRKGERALTLLMPITCKRRAKDADANASDEERDVITAFVYKSRWFVLSQTEGEAMPPAEIPQFDADRALSSLGIERVAFDGMDGNSQGFARRREIAISPLAQLPHKTLFHELAHVELGHTAEGIFVDAEQTPKSLREIEAEAVALLCCESLGLEGASYCRGYIQEWMRQGSGAAEIPDKSAQKIFSAADRILRAGRASDTADAAAN